MHKKKFHCQMIVFVFNAFEMFDRNNTEVAKRLLGATYSLYYTQYNWEHIRGIIDLHLLNINHLSCFNQKKMLLKSQTIRKKPRNMMQTANKSGSNKAQKKLFNSLNYMYCVANTWCMMIQCVCHVSLIRYSLEYWCISFL